MSSFNNISLHHSNIEPHQENQTSIHKEGRSFAKNTKEKRIQIKSLENDMFQCAEAQQRMDILIRMLQVACGMSNRDVYLLADREFLARIHANNVYAIIRIIVQNIKRKRDMQPNVAETAQLFLKRSLVYLLQEMTTERNITFFEEIAVFFPKDLQKFVLTNDERKPVQKIPSQLVDHLKLDKTQLLGMDIHLSLLGKLIKFKAFEFLNRYLEERVLRPDDGRDNAISLRRWVSYLKPVRTASMFLRADSLQSVKAVPADLLKLFCRCVDIETMLGSKVKQMKSYINLMETSLHNFPYDPYVASSLVEDFALQMAVRLIFVDGVSNSVLLQSRGMNNGRVGRRFQHQQSQYNQQQAQISKIQAQAMNREGIEILHIFARSIERIYLVGDPRRLDACAGALKKMESEIENIRAEVLAQRQAHEASLSADKELKLKQLRLEYKERQHNVQAKQDQAKQDQTQQTPQRLNNPDPITTENINSQQEAQLIPLRQAENNLRRDFNEKAKEEINKERINQRRHLRRRMLQIRQIIAHIQIEALSQDLSLSDHIISQNPSFFDEAFAAAQRVNQTDTVLQQNNLLPTPNIEENSDINFKQRHSYPHSFWGHNPLIIPSFSNSSQAAQLVSERASVGYQIPATPVLFTPLTSASIKLTEQSISLSAELERHNTIQSPNSPTFNQISGIYRQSDDSYTISHHTNALIYAPIASHPTVEQTRRQSTVQSEGNISDSGILSSPQGKNINSMGFNINNSPFSRYNQENSSISYPQPQISNIQSSSPFPLSPSPKPNQEQSPITTQHGYIGQTQQQNITSSQSVTSNTHQQLLEEQRPIITSLSFTPSLTSVAPPPLTAPHIHPLCIAPFTLSGASNSQSQQIIPQTPNTNQSFYNNQHQYNPKLPYISFPFAFSYSSGRENILLIQQTQSTIITPQYITHYNINNSRSPSLLQEITKQSSNQQTKPNTDIIDSEKKSSSQTAPSQDPSPSIPKTSPSSRPHSRSSLKLPISPSNTTAPSTAQISSSSQQSSSLSVIGSSSINNVAIPSLLAPQSSSAGDANTKITSNQLISPVPLGHIPTPIYSPSSKSSQDQDKQKKEGSESGNITQTPQFNQDSQNQQENGAINEQADIKDGRVLSDIQNLLTFPVSSILQQQQQQQQQVTQQQVHPKNQLPLQIVSLSPIFCSKFSPQLYSMPIFHSVLVQPYALNPLQFVSSLSKYSGGGSVGGGDCGASVAMRILRLLKNSFISDPSRTVAIHTLVVLERVSLVLSSKHQLEMECILLAEADKRAEKLEIADRLKEGKIYDQNEIMSNEYVLNETAQIFADEAKKITETAKSLIQKAEKATEDAKQAADVSQQLLTQQSNKNKKRNRNSLTEKTLTAIEATAASEQAIILQKQADSAADQARSAALLSVASAKAALVAASPSPIPNGLILLSFPPNITVQILHEASGAFGNASGFNMAHPVLFPIINVAQPTTLLTHSTELRDRNSLIKLCNFITKDLTEVCKVDLDIMLSIIRSSFRRGSINLSTGFEGNDVRARHSLISAACTFLQTNYQSSVTEEKVIDQNTQIQSTIGDSKKNNNLNINIRSFISRQPSRLYELSRFIHPGSSVSSASSIVNAIRQLHEYRGFFFNNRDYGFIRDMCLNALLKIVMEWRYYQNSFLMDKPNTRIFLYKNRIRTQIAFPYDQIVNKQSSLIPSSEIGAAISARGGQTPKPPTPSAINSSRTPDPNKQINKTSSPFQRAKSPVHTQHNQKPLNQNQLVQDSKLNKDKQLNQKKNIDSQIEDDSSGGRSGGGGRDASGDDEEEEEEEDDDEEDESDINDDDHDDDAGSILYNDSDLSDQEEEQQAKEKGRSKLPSNIVVIRTNYEPGSTRGSKGGIRVVGHTPQQQALFQEGLAHLQAIITKARDVTASERNIGLFMKRMGDGIAVTQFAILSTRAITSYRQALQRKYESVEQEERTKELKKEREIREKNILSPQSRTKEKGGVIWWGRVWGESCEERADIIRRYSSIRAAKLKYDRFKQNNHDNNLTLLSLKNEQDQSDFEDEFDIRRRVPIDPRTIWSHPSPLSASKKRIRRILSEYGMIEVAIEKIRRLHQSVKKIFPSTYRNKQPLTHFQAVYASYTFQLEGSNFAHFSYEDHYKSRGTLLFRIAAELYGRSREERRREQIKEDDKERRRILRRKGIIRESRRMSDGRKIMVELDQNRKEVNTELEFMQEEEDDDDYDYFDDYNSEELDEEDESEEQEDEEEEETEDMKKKEDAEKMESQEIVKQKEKENNQQQDEQDKVAKVEVEKDEEQVHEEESSQESSNEESQDESNDEDEDDSKDDEESDSQDDDDDDDQDSEDNNSSESQKKQKGKNKNIEIGNKKSDQKQNLQEKQKNMKKHETEKVKVDQSVDKQKVKEKIGEKNKQILQLKSKDKEEKEVKDAKQTINTNKDNEKKQKENQKIQEIDKVNSIQQSEKQKKKVDQLNKSQDPKKNKEDIEKNQLKQKDQEKGKSKDDIKEKEENKDISKVKQSEIEKLKKQDEKPKNQAKIHERQYSNENEERKEEGKDIRKLKEKKKEEVIVKDKKKEQKVDEKKYQINQKEKELARKDGDKNKEREIRNIREKKEQKNNQKQNEKKNIDKDHRKSKEDGKDQQKVNKRKVRKEEESSEDESESESEEDESSDEDESESTDEDEDEDDSDENDESNSRDKRRRRKQREQMQKQQQKKNNKDQKKKDQQQGSSKDKLNTSHKEINKKRSSGEERKKETSEDKHKEKNKNEQKLEKGQQQSQQQTQQQQQTQSHSKQNQQQVQMIEQIHQQQPQQHQIRQSGQKSIIYSQGGPPPSNPSRNNLNLSQGNVHQSRQQNPFANANSSSREQPQNQNQSQIDHSPNTNQNQQLNSTQGRISPSLSLSTSASTTSQTITQYSTQTQTQTQTQSLLSESQQSIQPRPLTSSSQQILNTKTPNILTPSPSPSQQSNNSSIITSQTRLISSSSVPIPSVQGPKAIQPQTSSDSKKTGDKSALNIESKNILSTQNQVLQQKETKKGSSEIKPKNVLASQSGTIGQSSQQQIKLQQSYDGPKFKIISITPQQNIQTAQSTNPQLNKNQSQIQSSQQQDLKTTHLNQQQISSTQVQPQQQSQISQQQPAQQQIKSNPQTSQQQITKQQLQPQHLQKQYQKQEQDTNLKEQQSQNSQKKPIQPSAQIKPIPPNILPNTSMKQQNKKDDHSASSTNLPPPLPSTGPPLHPPSVPSINTSNTSNTNTSSTHNTIKQTQGNSPSQKQQLSSSSKVQLSPLASASGGASVIQLPPEVIKQIQKDSSQSKVDVDALQITQTLHSIKSSPLTKSSTDVQKTTQVQQQKQHLQQQQQQPQLIHQQQVTSSRTEVAQYHPPKPKPKIVIQPQIKLISPPKNTQIIVNSQQMIRTTIPTSKRIQPITPPPASASQALADFKRAAVAEQGIKLRLNALTQAAEKETQRIIEQRQKRRPITIQRREKRKETMRYLNAMGKKCIRRRTPLTYPPLFDVYMATVWDALTLKEVHWAMEQMQRLVAVVFGLEKLQKRGSHYHYSGCMCERCSSQGFFYNFAFSTVCACGNSTLRNNTEISDKQQQQQQKSEDEEDNNPSSTIANISNNDNMNLSNIFPHIINKGSNILRRVVDLQGRVVDGDEWDESDESGSEQGEAEMLILEEEFSSEQDLENDEDDVLFIEQKTQDVETKKVRNRRSKANGAPNAVILRLINDKNADKPILSLEEIMMKKILYQSRKNIMPMENMINLNKLISFNSSLYNYSNFLTFSSNQAATKGKNFTDINGKLPIYSPQQNLLLMKNRTPFGEYPMGEYDFVVFMRDETEQDNNQKVAEGKIQSNVFGYTPSSIGSSNIVEQNEKGQQLQPQQSRPEKVLNTLIDGADDSEDLNDDDDDIEKDRLSPDITLEMKLCSLRSSKQQVMSYQQKEQNTNTEKKEKNDAGDIPSPLCTKNVQSTSVEQAQLQKLKQNLKSSPLTPELRQEIAQMRRRLKLRRARRIISQRRRLAAQSSIRNAKLSRLQRAAFHALNMIFYHYIDCVPPPAAIHREEGDSLLMTTAVALLHDEPAATEADAKKRRARNREMKQRGRNIFGDDTEIIQGRNNKNSFGGNWTKLQLKKHRQQGYTQKQGQGNIVNGNVPMDIMPKMPECYALIKLFFLSLNENLGIIRREPMTHGGWTVIGLTEEDDANSALGKVDDEDEIILNELQLKERGKFLNRSLEQSGMKTNQSSERQLNSQSIIRRINPKECGVILYNRNLYQFALDKENKVINGQQQSPQQNDNNNGYFNECIVVSLNQKRGEKKLERMRKQRDQEQERKNKRKNHDDKARDWDNSSSQDESNSIDDDDDDDDDDDNDDDNSLNNSNKPRWNKMRGGNTTQSDSLEEETDEDMDRQLDELEEKEELLRQQLRQELQLGGWGRRQLERVKYRVDKGDIVGFDAMWEMAMNWGSDRQPHVCDLPWPELIGPGFMFKGDVRVWDKSNTMDNDWNWVVGQQLQKPLNPPTSMLPFNPTQLANIIMPQGSPNELPISPALSVAAVLADNLRIQKGSGNFFPLPSVQSDTQKGIGLYINQSLIGFASSPTENVPILAICDYPKVVNPFDFLAPQISTATGACAQTVISATQRSTKQVAQLCPQISANSQLINSSSQQNQPGTNIASLSPSSTSPISLPPSIEATLKALLQSRVSVDLTRLNDPLALVHTLCKPRAYIRSHLLLEKVLFMSFSELMKTKDLLRRYNVWANQLQKEVQAEVEKVRMRKKNMNRRKSELIDVGDDDDDIDNYENEDEEDEESEEKEIDKNKDAELKKRIKWRYDLKREMLREDQKLEELVLYMNRAVNALLLLCSLLTSSKTPVSPYQRAMVVTSINPQMAKGQQFMIPVDLPVRPEHLQPNSKHSGGVWTSKHILCNVNAFLDDDPQTLRVRIGRATGVRPWCITVFSGELDITFDQRPLALLIGEKGPRTLRAGIVSGNAFKLNEIARRKNAQRKNLGEFEQSQRNTLMINTYANRLYRFRGGIRYQHQLTYGEKAERRRLRRLMIDAANIPDPLLHHELFYNVGVTFTSPEEDPFFQTQHHLNIIRTVAENIDYRVRRIVADATGEDIPIPSHYEEEIEFQNRIRQDKSPQRKETPTDGIFIDPASPEWINEQAIINQSWTIGGIGREGNDTNQKREQERPFPKVIILTDSQKTKLSPLQDMLYQEGARFINLFKKANSVIRNFETEQELKAKSEEDEGSRLSDIEKGKTHVIWKEKDHGELTDDQIDRDYFAKLIQQQKIEYETDYLSRQKLNSDMPLLAATGSATYPAFASQYQSSVQKMQSTFISQTPQQSSSTQVWKKKEVLQLNPKVVMLQNGVVIDGSFQQIRLQDNLDNEMPPSKNLYINTQQYQPQLYHYTQQQQQAQSIHRIQHQPSPQITQNIQSQPSIPLVKAPQVIFKLPPASQLPSLSQLQLNSQSQILQNNQQYQHQGSHPKKKKMTQPSKSQKSQEPSDASYVILSTANEAPHTNLVYRMRETIRNQQKQSQSSAEKLAFNEKDNNEDKDSSQQNQIKRK